MSNLEKSVAINLENTAHCENIFKSRYNFRTGESDSSVLLFIIKNNQPLLLSEENIKPHEYNDSRVKENGSCPTRNIRSI